MRNEALELDGGPRAHQRNLWRNMLAQTRDAKQNMRFLSQYASTKCYAKRNNTTKRVETMGL